MAKARKTTKARKTADKGKKFEFKHTPRTTEATLLEHYPHALAGTLEFDPATRKQSMLIRCSMIGCKAERRVATSDLFHCFRCMEHSKRGNGKAAAKPTKTPKGNVAGVPPKRVRIKLSNPSG